MVKSDSISNKALLDSLLIIFIFGFFTDVLLRNYISGLFGFILAILIAKCRDKSI